MDFVDLLDTVAYHVVGDGDSSPPPVDAPAFRSLLRSRGVPAKLWRIVDRDGDGSVSVDEIANALVMLSKRYFRKTLFCEREKFNSFYRNFFLKKHCYICRRESRHQKCLY